MYNIVLCLIISLGKQFLAIEYPGQKYIYIRLLMCTGSHSNMKDYLTIFTNALTSP